MLPRDARAGIATWSLRALHVGGFLLAASAAGSEWLGYPAWPGCVVLPAIAVLSARALMSAARVGRLRPAFAYPAAVLAFVLAGLAAVHAWSAGRTHLLALADMYLGPQGVSQSYAWLGADLVAATGAMLTAVVAGRRDLWGAFAWFVWCYWFVSIVGRAAGLGESAYYAYDAHHNRFVSLPAGAMLAASAAFVLALIAALIRRARHLSRGTPAPTTDPPPTAQA